MTTVGKYLDLKLAYASISFSIKWLTTPASFQLFEEDLEALKLSSTHFLVFSKSNANI